MTDHRCETCAAFCRDVHGSTHCRGECRHDPPVPGWGWPIVTADQWCRQWCARRPIQTNVLPPTWQPWPTTAGGTITTAPTTVWYGINNGGVRER